MNQIKNFLESNPASVKLYFLERNEDTNGKVVYNVLKTKISEDIRQNLIEISLNQVKKTLKKNPEFNEYNLVPYSDKFMIEKIAKDKVPFLNEILLKILGSSLDQFKINKTGKIWGYIVKMEIENKSLFLFKKYTPQKLLEKGKFHIEVNDGKLRKITEQVMILDENFDAVLLLTEISDSEVEKKESPEVFVFNRFQFESLFTFKNYYVKEVEKRKDEITKLGLLNSTDDLVHICKNNSNMIRKLARILEYNDLSKLELSKIKKCCEDFNLENINFNKEGKILVNDGNIWTVLRILEDDHLKSDLTSSKYEARSKVKK